MDWSKKKILSVLDRCAQEFTFPMLDNGYVYLAATRMSLFRSAVDWGLVIETFGFSPRSGRPDTQISTFSSNPYNRNSESDYVTRDAYEKYLKNNPYNESTFIFPIDDEAWHDADNPESTRPNAVCQLRGLAVQLPSAQEYEKHGISLEEKIPLTFEFCRYLASVHRDLVLATELERKSNIHPGLDQILQLEEWHHPDLSGGELPSQTRAFTEIVEVLVTGDISKYRAAEPSNTHWKHWPDGGTL